MDKWQLIETAPRDGSRILICDMNALEPGADIVFWHRGDWATGDESPWEKASNMGFKEIYDRPTHWMPLPEPPK